MLKHNNAARSRLCTYIHTHSLCSSLINIQTLVRPHIIIPLIIPTKVEILNQLHIMAELTTIISNMGATKAHIVPLASDNQQLHR